MMAPFTAVTKAFRAAVKPHTARNFKSKCNTQVIPKSILQRLNHQTIRTLNSNQEYSTFFHPRYSYTFIDRQIRQKIATCGVVLLKGDLKRFSSKPRKRRLPKLVLLQSPFKWVVNKFDLRVLKIAWDPPFDESEFKEGTKQAVARVTQVLGNGTYEELHGLLTKAARSALMRDVERTWPEFQRKYISFNNTDIQIATPRKVYFIRIADKRYCDVDMAFMGLKWLTPDNPENGMVFAEIFSRFHREYTPHSIPEWTIAYFKITRFNFVDR